MDQCKEAQYFIPQMDPYELYYTIVQQMSLRVHETVATVDFSKFDKVSEALSQLDLIFSDKVLSQKNILIIQVIGIRVIRKIRKIMKINSINHMLEH